MPPKSPGFLNDPKSWIRANLFNGPVNSILSLVVLAFLVWILVPLANWAIVKATLVPDPAACRASGGACWGFVTEKYRLILFGVYPYAEQWRPSLAMVLFIAMTLISAHPANWRRLWLPLMWLAGLPACGLLMWGGVLGLPYVPNERWGGLPLTLILSMVGIGLSFPLAIWAAFQRPPVSATRALNQFMKNDMTRLMVR
ncbi:hypothetical protein FACS1894205_6310 [Alphaproteobacteria bacterium]|nr:hypothetical protein FACS1894205_6310 [Alphaproteobacteria bacterium]